MITLHTSPGSSGLVVHWLLIELEIPHTIKNLDLAAKEHKQPAYLALNPAGVVPTLIVDGTPVTEAAAIALHLTDAHPARGFAPAAGTLARAAYYQWMFFATNTLQPAYRAWFYPHEPAGEATADAAKAVAKSRVEDGWARVDSHLAAHGPHMLGETLSTADFMFTMLMRWSRNMPRPATSWPAVERLAKLMKARPSFKELYAREGLTDWT
jgi:glutathione S-transferase